MKKIYSGFRFALVIVTILTAIGAKAQTDAEPIITIHSSAFNEIGDDNKFSLFLGTISTGTYTVEQCTGTTTVEVQPGSFNSSTGEFEGTWIPCKVDAEGIIKVYGDPENINILSAEGAYITSIDMDRCVNLEAINLQHNALQRLDLTPFTNAFAIYLSDNPFTAETPLVVGAPKPYLAILEIDIVDHLDQSFNLSDYPNMVAFDGYANSDLHNVDPTGCPNLMVLSVEMTPVETLDVSKNPELMRLNIAESRVRNIDISHNTKLQHLIGSHDSGTINTDIKLENIDLSHNTELTLLNLSSNDLTSIDLSNNTKLTNITLSRNHFTSLDLSKNTALYSVNIMNNYMDFATLPLPEPTWGEYFYSQRPLDMPRSVAKDQTIDLSAKVLRSETETTVALFRKPYDREPITLNEAFYTYEDGKLTVNTVLPDSIYAVFYNSAFTEYPLTTEPFMVKNPEDMNKPSRIVTLTLSAPVENALSFNVGIDGASPESPKTFYVVTSDNRYECTATGDPATPDVNIQLTESISGMVEIWINEGDVMTSIDVSSMKLSTLNVQAATELRSITADNCGLNHIDLRYNRCLQSLSLSGNNLTSINLAGIYGNYEKYVLTDLDLSHNQLTEVGIVSQRQIKNLNLSYNQLKEYQLKDYDMLNILDLSHNELSGEFSLTYLAGAAGINLSGNHITSLVLPEFTALDNFDVTSNNLTIASLPLTSGFAASTQYIYAPQLPIQLDAMANTVNLSAQNREINGEYASFAWFRADGSQLTAGEDYVISDGKTTFLNNDLGKVYCHISHPAFPRFEGENVLSTTEVQVAGAPDVLVASFTTLEDRDDGEVIFASWTNSTLFIDWKGDGSDIREYPTVTEYTDYTGQRTYAGANVKVYSFVSPENVSVFSLYDMKLANADLSALTKAKTLAVGGADLTPDQLKLPVNPTLIELSLPGNKFTDYPYFDNYPSLRSLVLSHNDLTVFDASKLSSLLALSIDVNHLTGIKFDNPVLWGVSVAANELASLDLNGLPALHQLIANNNKLSALDLSPVEETIHSLDITNNRFTFATFPDIYSCPNLTTVRMAGQADVPAECIDGKVDLSWMLEGYGDGTMFAWYLGEAYYDSETDMIVGEQLTEGEDYTIENGTTIFLKDFDSKVMCIMSNDLFSGILLKTPLIDVTAAGITTVATDKTCAVDVFNMLGIAVRTGVDRSEALHGLSPGIYVIGNQKFIVK